MQTQTITRQSIVYQVAVIVDGVTHSLERHDCTESVNAAIAAGECGDSDEEIVQRVATKEV